MHDRCGAPMHVRTVILVALELLAVGGCTDDLDAHTDVLVREIAAADLEQDDQCDDLRDEAECLGAGCRWQPLVGAVLESDDSCRYGEPLGLCFADDLAQPCDPDARRCADGSFAWVLPGPDNAALVAYSATSCGVPDHFMPCPTAPNDLTADVEVPPNGADDLDAVVPEACTCACEDL